MGDIVVRIYYTNAKDELNANIYKIYSCDILDCMGIAISVMRVLAKIYIKCLLGWTQYKQSQWAIVLIWLVFFGYSHLIGFNCNNVLLSPHIGYLLLIWS